MTLDGVQPAEDELPDIEAKPEMGGPPGSKIIVIHLGSQNMRIGLASDPLPKTVPMVVARKAQRSESEEDTDEPRPKKRKVEGQGEQVMFEEWVSSRSCIG